MRLVDLDLRRQHLFVRHHDIQHLTGHALEQREASFLDMTDQLLGDGAVIERFTDVVELHGACRAIADHHVDHDILAILDLVFVDPDIGSQTQILDANGGEVVIEMFIVQGMHRHRQGLLIKGNARDDSQTRTPPRKAASSLCCQLINVRNS